MEIRNATTEDLHAIAAVEAACFPAAEASLHDAHGAWQMIFGVNTLPGCRRRGYAGLLLQRAIADARAQGRKGLVLTCKEKLLHYYAKFGFVNEGVSASTHGGVVWYQKRLRF